MPTIVNRARVPFSMHSVRLQYILHTEEDIYPLGYILLEIGTDFGPKQPSYGLEADAVRV